MFFPLLLRSKVILAPSINAQKGLVARPEVIYGPTGYVTYVVAVAKLQERRRRRGGQKVSVGHRDSIIETNEG